MTALHTVCSDVSYFIISTHQCDVFLLERPLRVASSVTYPNYALCSHSNGTECLDGGGGGGGGGGASQIVK